MNKKLALLLAVIMVLSVALTACGGGNTESSTPSTPSTPSDSSGSAPVEPDDPWAALDTSAPVTIVMYATGTEPTDMAEVLPLVNEKLQEKINTTLDLNFFPAGEVSTRYPLLMAGGDVVDLIYTANYLYYNEQVEKQGFVELTDEFLQTYMPVSYGILPPSAWDEMRVNDKIYAVPRNTAAIFAERGVVLNMDAAALIGTTEIKTWEDYKKFLLDFAAADNTPEGMYGFAATANATLSTIALTQTNNLINGQIAGGFYVAVPDGIGPEDWFYLWTSDYYKTYCLEMAELAAAGVWATDAITQTTSISTSFKEQKSAATTQNFYNGITTIASWRDNAGLNVKMFNIMPEDYRGVRDAFAGDAYAIPSFSEIPERAAICLDVMKTDWETYMLLAGGIEGRHYVYNADNNTIANGPEATDYVFDGWAWGLRHVDFPWPDSSADPICDETSKWLEENRLSDETEWLYWGFNFDYSSVAAEYAVIDAVRSEFGTSFGLGQFGADTEAKFEEYKAQIEAGGFATYEETYMTQIKAYYDSKKA